MVAKAGSDLRLDTSGEGHIDAEEIEAGHGRRCRRSFVAGMKRAGWTEIEMPEDLEEMAWGLLS